MNLGLPGFIALGLNHRSVGNLAEHRERTPVWVMGYRKEASALGFSKGGGVLSGSEWDVREKAQSAGASVASL